MLERRRGELAWGSGSLPSAARLPSDEPDFPSTLFLDNENLKKKKKEDDWLRFDVDAQLGLVVGEDEDRINK